MQPFVVARGEMDESRQQVVGSLLLGKVVMNLIHLGTLVSRMVFPTNLAGKPILFLLFHASPSIFLGLRGSTFIVRIFIFHFCLIFHVTSIFMSIVGRFFGTWFLPMVFYFRLRN
jgi:hypothetical protein